MTFGIAAAGTSPALEAILDNPPVHLIAVAASPGLASHWQSLGRPVLRIRPN
jgi:hypothetical protein